VLLEAKQQDCFIVQAKFGRDWIFPLFGFNQENGLTSQWSNIIIP